jgi:hypothetical protein
MSPEPYEPFDEPWPFAEPALSRPRVLQEFPPTNDPDPDRRFTVPATEVVLIDETPLGPALDLVAEMRPLEGAWLKAYWNLMVLPRVLEAFRVGASAARDLKARNAQADQANAPHLLRLGQIEAAKDALVARRLQDKHAYTQARGKALLACAAPLAKARRAFDGQKLIPELPDPALVRKPTAHAAALKLPVSPNEDTYFLPSALEWALSAFAGAIAGIGYFAAGRIVHIDALRNEWPLALFGASVGIAMTLLAGNGVKNLWRFASKAYHAERPWAGRILLATTASLGCFALETVIGMRGLMASALTHDRLAMLSGKTAVASMPTLTAVFLGGAMALGYFLYASVRGFMQEQTAAEHRIIASQEDERLALLASERDSDAWIAVLEAGNTVLALDAAEEAASNAFQGAMEVLQAREQEVRALLKPIESVPSVAYTARQRVARNGAEGAQAEFNRYFQALVAGRRYVPRYLRRSGRHGLWELLKAWFQAKASRQGGG